MDDNIHYSMHKANERDELCLVEMCFSLVQPEVWISLNAVLPLSLLQYCWYENICRCSVSIFSQAVTVWDHHLPPDSLKHIMTDCKPHWCKEGWSHEDVKEKLLVFGFRLVGIKVKRKSHASVMAWIQQHEYETWSKQMWRGFECCGYQKDLC